MTEPLTTSDQDTLRDALVIIVKNWLTNELPPPYLGITKADASIVFYLAAQKFQEELLLEPLS